MTNFEDFYNWIKNNKGVTALEDLFNDNSGWVNQSNKIQNWWNEYKE